jgi:DNA-binding transcriptional MocR family regulator
MSTDTMRDATTDDLKALHARAKDEYEGFRAKGLKLDMTRGKPAPDQLDLSNAMLTLPGNGDFFSAAGEDGRNYGNLQGLAEARALFAPLLQATPAQIVVGDNSSLALMHDCVAYALLKGVPGSPKPWMKESSPAFICPVPGYDRHFAICEEFGIRMLTVPMTAQGPDMDAVENLAADPAVKGIWCVPKYSNPGGEILSQETAQRLAAMKTGAADFRIFWDNAYGVHHLTPQRHAIPDILALCAEAGHADRAFVFASTSKITFAGAGLAFFAASPANVRWFLERTFFRTIGGDKLNQIRHVRFLRDFAGVEQHMEKHRTLIAPKFDAVAAALEHRLAGTGLARWSKPEGGYFITVDAVDGTARKIVELAKQAGVTLTPAGSTWPGGKDPHDANLRLAPTFPSLADVKTASEIIALSIYLAGLEATLAERG